MAVARGIVNMQSIGLAALYGAPSGDLEASNKFFEEASQLISFFELVLPSPQVATGPIQMQGYELATLFVTPLDFQNFCVRDLRKLVGVFGVLIEVATGAL